MLLLFFGSDGSELSSWLGLELVIGKSKLLLVGFSELVGWETVISETSEFDLGESLT